jgi:hypothetical protein
MNARNTRYTFPPSVLSQIAQLPELPMIEIKALWNRLFDTEIPNYNRQFLERRIKVLIETGKLRGREKDCRPLPGNVLIRHYQDVEHRVVVEADGQYQYEGSRYASLSAIAREITGTRWSGPLFFGL